MKKIIAYLLFISVISCAKSDKNPISNEKMVDIIYELTMASSASAVANTSDSVQYYVNANTILKKHGIDSLTFVKAQSFYQNNPEAYLVIYDSVKGRIQKELEKVQKLPLDEEDEVLKVNLKELKKSSRLIMKNIK